MTGKLKTMSSGSRRMSMVKKYRVTLTSAERAELEELSRKRQAKLSL
jgi:hypothetical protein